jgi:hypothetical protein
LRGALFDPGRLPKLLESPFSRSRLCVLQSSPRDAGQQPDGTNHYTLHFAPGEFPPVNAFWSLTMYDYPAQLMVANPLNRYLLNSPMIPQFKKDADGGLTLYFQNESPGIDKESNWLPAPKGPFLMVMLLYWPKPEALEGKWTAPPLEKVE